MNPKVKGVLCMLSLAAAIVVAAVYPSTPAIATQPMTDMQQAAQSMPDMSANMAAPEQVIHGATDSDKIKDVDAWMIFLKAANEASTYDEIRFLFRQPSLTDEQADQIQKAISNYNTQFAAIESQYNVVADANGHSGIDNRLNEKSFVRARKQVTRDSESQIEDILGSLGSAEFHQLLQYYKKNFNIAIEEDN